MVAQITRRSPALAQAPRAAQDNLKKAEEVIAAAVTNLGKRAGAISDAMGALGKLENESKGLVFELDRAEPRSWGLPAPGWGGQVIAATVPRT
jgi:hypothetical protein